MLRTIPIDKDAFDAAQAYRADWLIGRAITDKKGSEDYYEELSRNGFLISSVGTDGRMSVTPWLDNITPTVTFNSANILKGSLGNMTLTPLNKMYNDFVIKYDYNPGSEKFNKQLTITNIDRANLGVLFFTFASL